MKDGKWITDAIRKNTIDSFFNFQLEINNGEGFIFLYTGFG